MSYQKRDRRDGFKGGNHPDRISRRHRSNTLERKAIILFLRSDRVLFFPLAVQLERALIGIDVELWAASRLLRLLVTSAEFNTLAEGQNEDTRFALARLRSALDETIPYTRHRDWTGLPIQRIDLESLLLQKFEDLDDDSVEARTLDEPDGIYYSTDIDPVNFLELLLKYRSDLQKLEAQILLAAMTNSDMKELDFFPLVDLVSRNL